MWTLFFVIILILQFIKKAAVSTYSINSTCSLATIWQRSPPCFSSLGKNDYKIKKRKLDLNILSYLPCPESSCALHYDEQSETYTYNLSYFLVLFFILNSYSVEDLERNDGSEEKPYYMTDSLKKIMDVKNKKPEGASTET